MVCDQNSPCMSEQVNTSDANGLTINYSENTDHLPTTGSPKSLATFLHTSNLGMRPWEHTLAVVKDLKNQPDANAVITWPNEHPWPNKTMIFSTE